MDKKTEQSRSNYNKKAADYENTAEGRFTLPYNQMICEMVTVRDADRVLDVACGNGRLLKMLSGKAKILASGIDISEDMIRVAAQEYPEMQFHVSSACQTPFEDNLFDLITLCCAFHHFTEPKSFMTEVNRILKPGGKLLIAEPYLPIVLRQIENLILPFLKMGDVRTYSEKELMQFYAHAGFLDITQRRIGMRLFTEGIKG